MTTESWVVVRKATSEAVLETFSRKVADAINLEKYEVVPILEWIYSLNAKQQCKIKSDRKNHV